MHTRTNTIISFFLCLLVWCQKGYTQASCKDFDLLNVPGKWNWKLSGSSNPVSPQLWTICDPINKEFQRIMPKAPDGAIAYSFMIDGGPGTFYNLKRGARYYRNYFMVKDYECNLKPNPVAQPEGTTGCWVYFDVNNHNSYGKQLPGGIELMIDNFRYLYHTEIWTELDANGNRLLYSRSDGRTIVNEGYLFSASKRLPYRKITRKELYESYKNFHEKRLEKEIERYEKAAKKDQAEYDRLPNDQKQQQSYRLKSVEEAKKSMAFFVAQKEKMNKWYAVAIKEPGLTEFANPEQIAVGQFDPEKLKSAPGLGRPVWVDDISFYDTTKPATQPQLIFLHYRRQDEDLPKKNFMDKFFAGFNLDLLYKMVGDTLKKPGKFNVISSSIDDTKKTTRQQQESNASSSLDMNNTAIDQYPTDWRGMKNIRVEKYEGKKWLAMTKDGYWYPRQYNKEIKDGFSLTFDLCWNPQISYYSGLFTVTLGEVVYDNARQEYNVEDGGSAGLSMYQSYTGDFNRIALWFDPHWNGGGSLTIYSYDRSETVRSKTQVTLPNFFKDKNKHQITIERKGFDLLVFDNGNKIAAMQDVFIKEVKYNLFTFSRYKGNGAGKEMDVFYVDGVKVKY